MGTKNQHTQLTRETAWWFIPEEYCPIFLELEKEFNKKIGKPILLENLSEIVDILKSARMNHYYGLAEKYEDSIKELDKTINANGDSDGKLSVAKGKAEIKQIRYNGYGEILEEMDKNVIVSHFIKYFENVGILINENNTFFSFSKISDYIANYKVPFVTAQIILDYITCDLESHPTSRTMLFEAMHSLIQDPLFSIEFKDVKNRAAALEIVYLERFKDGLQILKNNGLVSKAKGIKGHYEFVYKLKYEPLNDVSTEDADKGLNNQRRMAALKELEQIHTRFNQTTSTSKEKEKGRLKQAQKDIDKKLSNITIQSIGDRILYHWYHSILLHWFSDIKSIEFITDVITYIRYNNIRTAVTPVVEGELYKWDMSYSIWERLLLLIEKDFINSSKVNHSRSNKTFALAIELPSEISLEEYNNATHRIIREVTRFIGCDKFITDAYTGEIADNKISGDQVKQNIRLFSLLYVRATVEANTGHFDAISHLEYLYKFACKNSYTYAEADQLLLISKLSGFSERNIEYPIKAKGWIYKINRISFNGKGNDKIWTLIPIYQNLILLDSKDDGANSEDRYYEIYLGLLNAINLCDFTDKFLLIQDKLFLLKRKIDDYSYDDVSRKIVDVWDSINNLYSQYASPYLLILKTELFLLGADYLAQYLEFGYSLAIISSSIYLELRDLDIVCDYIYYTLLDAMSKYISSFDSFMPSFNDRYELKLKMASGEYLTNKCFFYKSMAGELFEKGYLLSGCTYAKKSAELADINNLTASEGIADYLAVRLQMVAPLLQLGNYNEAAEIIEDSRNIVSELQELLSESERTGLIQDAIDIFSEIDEVYTKHPLRKRELRLDYLLHKTRELEEFPEDLSASIYSFYDKWKQFIGMYNFYSDRVDPKLKVEFESSSFPNTLEQFAKELPLEISEPIIKGATDDDIYMLNKFLIECYEKYQGYFILDEDDTNVTFQLPEGTTVEYPSIGQFFDFFRNLIDR